MNPWNDTSIEWKDTSVLPEAGLMVLIHIPGDFEPIWFGFWDGRQWHYVEGLAVRAKVWHWCEIPKPPTEKLGGWQAAEVPPALITAA